MHVICFFSLQLISLVVTKQAPLLEGFVQSQPVFCSVAMLQLVQERRKEKHESKFRKKGGQFSFFLFFLARNINCDVLIG